MRNMLINPRYAALMTHTWGKIVGKGEWEPIIDEDTHWRCGAAEDPARGSQQGIERVISVPVSIVCGFCGGTAEAGHHQEGPRGKRRSRLRLPHRLPPVRTQVKALDAHVEEWILGWLARDDVSRYTGDDTEDVAELARRRDGLRARLDGLGLMCAAGRSTNLSCASAPPNYASRWRASTRCWPP